MAVAELEVKSRSSAWFFLSSISYEFDEIAHVTAEIPYATRGENNFLESANLILRFFSGEGTTGKRDLFFFLRGITGVNLGQILKKISRSEKRLLHYVFSAVNRHVASSSRYRRSGSTVTDLEAVVPQTLRQAGADEIVCGCSAMLQGSETPGGVVDLIFDHISGDERYACYLPVSTLRTAAYELIKSRFILPRREITRIDPMQEYLQKELLGLAEEAIACTVDSYHWRAGGSVEYRDAYKRAGRDMLEEIVIHGRKIPQQEALGRHVEGCSQEVYRAKHRGSFQNFWKSLWENFLKKIRADI